MTEKADTTWWLNVAMTMMGQPTALARPGQPQTPVGQAILVAQYTFMIQTWSGPLTEDYETVNGSVGALIQRIHPTTEGLHHVEASAKIFDALVNQYGKEEGRRVEIQGGGSGQAGSDTLRWGADYHPVVSVHEEPTQESLDNLRNFPSTD